jgi:hypothetical protein
MKFESRPECSMHSNATLEFADVLEIFYEIGNFVVIYFIILGTGRWGTI